MGCILSDNVQEMGSTFAVVAGFCCESGRILPVVSPHLLLVDCVLSSLHLFNFLPATMSQENQPSLLIPRTPPSPSRNRPPPSSSTAQTAPEGPAAARRQTRPPSAPSPHRPSPAATPRLLTYLRILPCQWQWRRQRQRRWQLPSPPDHSSSPYSSHDSLHTNHAKQLGYNYTAPSSPAPSRRASQAKIHFAPLPAVPPEFRRRNSISLGVASRRNLIGMQGHGQKGGVQSVVMSDEDWDNYCKQFEEKHG